jgi:hypothetical protein
VEVSYLPTVMGGAIQEFAGEVTSKALFNRFDKELELCLISYQCCFSERHLRFFSLRFLLSSQFHLLLPFLFCFFLQDCLHSLLQLGYLSLEVSDLLMGLLDLPCSHLEQILLWLLMLLEGIFEGFHVMVDLLSKLI